MIKVLNATQKPITFMGKCSGCCYGSNIERDDLNYKRGLKNIQDGHGRIMEYADVTLEISEYSARAIRELYTHVIGTSRVQESTRYVEYTPDNFIYYVPETVEGVAYADDIYYDTMQSIFNGYIKLLELGIPKEDAANLLPLGLNTKIVLKINYRALLHFAEMRLCERAYKEIRDLTNEMIDVIGSVDDEWKELMSFMKPKCKTCTEKHSCPRLK